MPAPRRAIALTALMAAAAGVFFASRSVAQPAETHTVSGTFVLHGGSSSMVPGHDCHGTGGYGDIGPAATATIKNETGRILAATQLGLGVVGKDYTSCVFTFMAQVPRADFYVLSVSRRGDVTFHYDQLVSDGWAMGGTLGD